MKLLNNEQALYQTKNINIILFQNSRCKVGIKLVFYPSNHSNRYKMNTKKLLVDELFVQE